MIKLEHINKYYNSSLGKFHALKDITLTFPDQGMVYIVGKSGSGKSTLLNVIGGIDNYDSGKLIIENNVTTESGETFTNVVDTENFKRKDYNAYRNTYIGFIFQEFNVVKSLTVYENIALSLELQQKNPKEFHEDILSIIEKVGLKGKDKRRINELSGGERQRVAIARALIKDPKVIIADEPTGNLDSKNRDIVMDILKNLSKEKLVLIVTHDKHLSSLYGDREIVIKDGEIINDTIIHPENLKDVVPTKHEIKSISPKAKVSLSLAWKGFKLNKVRFIFIILLFSLSLVFAGSVVNLYLADTTKEYAVYQRDYGNFVVTLSNQYNYQGTERTTGFYSYNLSELKKNFNNKDNEGMSTFTSMKINQNIYKLESEDDYDAFYKKDIENIIVYENDTTLNLEFKISNIFYTASDYKCYITDYLAESLVSNNYFEDSSVSSYNITGRKIKLDGMANPLVICGIIDTNYENFYFADDFDEDIKKQAAFEDNLAMYNALFISDTVYKKIYTAGNLLYFYDDILYHDNNKNTPYDHVKFSYITANTKIYDNKGNFPIKPEQGEITQVAVSKGFLEHVVGVKAENASFANTETNTKLLLSSNNPYNFYLCGTSRIPMSMEFNITGIIDEEEIAVYAPATSESGLINSWIATSFVQGGYLTVKISDDVQTNSKIYRNLLDNEITINNPSFVKLQLVDNFISDNLYLFAGLFFTFCLFSILMIFNFVIINIKNSTRDIGIYMSLGMNGFKISLIYLFQIVIISSIAVVIGLIGSQVFLSSIDSSFSAQALIDFKILKYTIFGVIGVVILGYITPFIAIASPLLSLSRKKPIDVIKIS